jgi:hypothetical protein
MRDPRTDHFTVSFFDVMATEPCLRLTVLNVPEPEVYFGKDDWRASYYRDQEAIARHIAVSLLVEYDQPTPAYGIHAQRVYR